jgi:ubiquitin carboxyl-terminal hydrolase 10
VRLLTSGPGVARTTAISYAGSAATTTTNLTPSTKIRPRGLINSGNMCFANSVLQIMVYCPPFHRLFAELGKVLGGVGLSAVAGTSASGTSASGTSASGTAAEASAYPLVEATVEFLKEFVVDDDRSKELKDPKGKANANINGKIASGSASGSGSSSRTSSSRAGKGKERERGDSVNDASGGRGAVGGREDEDGGTESFLPTYVYDAMKVKKRFEHMRVSFGVFYILVSFPRFSFSSSSILFSSLLFLSLLVLMTNPIIQGGHQEDAEEFFGFYLDTLEEELLAMLTAVSAPPPSIPASMGSTNAAPGKNAKVGSVTGTTNAATAASAYTESESVVSHEDADGDGWLEVGKRNRTVVTRTVCLFFLSFFWFCVAFLGFHYFLPSILIPFFPSFLPYFLAHLLVY